MFRKVIFWSHLVVGVTAGLVILMLSFTGVLIAYEYQMMENADLKLYAIEDRGEEPLALDQLMSNAGQELGKDISGVVVRNVPGAPIQVAYDRRGATYANPYTGELLGNGDEGIRNFLAPIRNWHRYFNADRDNQGIARAVTGAANVIFLFILFSGFYLWFPKIWKTMPFRIRLWFKSGPNSKFRDYNWHHVFGFWSLIPLIAIVISGTAISYPAVKTFVGNVTAEPGQVLDRGRPAPRTPPTIEAPAGAEQMDLASLIAITQNELGDDWYKITASTPRDANSTTEMRITLEKSMAPTKDMSWSLNPYTGEIVDKYGWEQMSRPAKADQVMRRLHTGEFYGFIGQTIAALVSLFACIMVYTGLALAWRRLISPLFKKRKSNA